MIRFKGTNSSFQLKRFRDDHFFLDSKAENEYAERVIGRLMSAIENRKWTLKNARLNIMHLDNQAAAARCRDDQV
jgi:hypothetical protein